MRIILASASPRRRELLTQMGLTFEVIPSKGEEIITKQCPSEVVMELAEQKASEIAAQFADARKIVEEETESNLDVREIMEKETKVDLDVLVIGADTVVVKDGQILGKPGDEADAVRMLTLLQGSTHQVYTGVCLIHYSNGQEIRHTFYEATDVEFYPMSEAEIRSYVATKEPMDKAGAYGIQGKCAVYIRGIRGDYNNVVGLPIARLYHELDKIGCAGTE